MRGRAALTAATRAALRALPGVFALPAEATRCVEITTAPGGAAAGRACFCLPVSLHALQGELSQLFCAQAKATLWQTIAPPAAMRKNGGEIIKDGRYVGFGFDLGRHLDQYPGTESCNYKRWHYENVSRGGNRL